MKWKEVPRYWSTGVPEGCSRIAVGGSCVQRHPVLAIPLAYLGALPRPIYGLELGQFFFRRGFPLDKTG